MVLLKNRGGEKLLINTIQIFEESSRSSAEENEGQIVVDCCVLFVIVFGMLGERRKWVPERTLNTEL